MSVPASTKVSTPMPRRIRSRSVPSSPERAPLANQVLPRRRFQLTDELDAGRPLDAMHAFGAVELTAHVEQVRLVLLLREQHGPADLPVGVDSSGGTAYPVVAAGHRCAAGFVEGQPSTLLPVGDDQGRP